LDIKELQVDFIVLRNLGCPLICYAFVWYIETNVSGRVKDVKYKIGVPQHQIINVKRRQFSIMS